MAILKNIGAGIVAIAIGAVLAYATDYVLQIAGLLPKDNIYVAWWIIALVILYRSAYTTLGCYVAAKIVPVNAMTLVITLGVIGFVVSMAGAIATWNQNLGPHWYPITLAILALPSAWLGGKWAKR